MSIVTSMRHVALALVMGAGLLHAQRNVLVQPTGVSVTIGEGAERRSIEQASVPIALVFPMHRRFTVDVTTAVAYTRVVENDSVVSEIYGGTDTQLRASFQPWLDHLVLTLGVNAPSGQYYVDSEQAAAAGLIGNDFLFFPISSMGNGPAGTAGAALAFQLLNWNIGLGGSLRSAMAFTPYGSGVNELRYQPADETRLQMTLERRLWLGTASLGVTHARFGAEQFDSTTYATGDRVITSAGWSVDVWKAQLALGLWHLSRDAGERLGGVAPKEAIRNLSATLRLPLFKWSVLPSIDSRRWRADGRPAGDLRNLTLALSIPAGATAVVEPRVSLSNGTLYGLGGSEYPLTGWQGSLLIRRR